MAAGCTQLVLVTGARSRRALPTCIAAVGCKASTSSRACTGLNRTLGLSDKLFVLVDSVLLTGLGRIMMMPSLVLAARVCPEVRTFTRLIRTVCHGPPQSLNVSVLGASCKFSSTLCLPFLP